MAQVLRRQTVIASEAKQSSNKSGLLRRFAPRNDDDPNAST
jgi:hypothetical protein